MANKDNGRNRRRKKAFIAIPENFDYSYRKNNYYYYIGTLQKNFSKKNKDLIQLFEKSPAFSLNNFEGPLELLLYLSQKEEIDICDIEMHEVTAQFIEQLASIDEGAEFLGLGSTLLLMKSRRLLPGEESSEEEVDPRFEMIHKLLEYCHFKEVAKELTQLEQERETLFSRNFSPPEKLRGDGLEEIGLKDLTQLLNSVLEQAAKRPKVLVYEEKWQVEPKMQWLKAELEQRKKIPFDEIFAPEKSRGELIVFFLALLELMKAQMATAIKENQNIYIIESYV